MPKAKPEVVKETEAERVTKHRRKFFNEVLGETCSTEDIEKLVVSESSPHQARDMIRNQCPPSLVVEILA